jgi:hypothetical protein
MHAIVIALILLIASTLISSLLVHKQKPPKPAMLSDFNIPQVEEGTPQCVLFGQCWNSGWQSLWYGDLTTKKIKK